VSTYNFYLDLLSNGLGFNIVMHWSLIVTALLAIVTIAYCGPENDDLAPFGYRPTTVYTNAVEFSDPYYNFYYKVNGQTVLQYFLDTSAVALQQGTWEVGVKNAAGDSIGYIVTGSGPNYGTARPFEWVNALVSSSFTHELQAVDETVLLTFTVNINTTNAAIAHKYNVKFSIKGITLKFEVSDPFTTPGSSDNWAGYFVGETRNTPNPTIHRIPYLPDPFFSFDVGTQRYYGSHYLDRSKSNGAAFRPYFAKSANSVSATYVTALPKGTVTAGVGGSKLLNL